ncbi:MAG TPA: glucose-6-phosphate dehydrogenase assembly protein OpcA [Streptosporangiaceae bacterium]|jgi:glucose-6-phosphate dehydrogenase assembly protein OpcA|nr:glucose-6-phosphate dehydrogenase assembly protein OpcA [Streptosporangiaceae bacterium]
MLTDLTDTTTADIRAALTRARDQMGGPATGVVLNLIIMTDESGQHDAVRAASQAGREHPCRVLAVIAREARAPSRLDAEIRSGDGMPGQTVLLRLYGPMSEHADSVIMPLLVPDTPVVTWWHGLLPAAPARQPLGVLAQRRVTDAASARTPAEALAVLAAGYQPGDTDFSWTRATPWRSLIAAIMDSEPGPITGGVVCAEEQNPTADLLAAWLGSRLDVEFLREDSGGPGITEVRMTTPDGDIVVHRPDGRVATLTRPGQPDRHVALQRRERADLLAEELRRLDPDEIYGESLAAVAELRTV